MQREYVGLSKMSQYWGWILGLGIFLMVMGITAVWYATVATIAVMTLFGILLVASGLVQLILAALGKHWKGFGLSILLGLLNLVVGSWIIIQPQTAAVALTLVIAIFLVASGLFRIILAIMVRKETSIVWIFAGGLISLILGILIWMHWPDASTWIIGLYVGIDVFLNGWALMNLSFAARSARQLGHGSQM